MTGSGIFAAGGEAEDDESANASATPARTAPKNYQVLLCDFFKGPCRLILILFCLGCTPGNPSVLILDSIVLFSDAALIYWDLRKDEEFDLCS